MPNSTPLLSIKLRIPPARPASRLVPRPRLVERLDEIWARLRSVTLISAPPGFGKTTLLGEWIASGFGKTAAAIGNPQSIIHNRSAAWLSLDEDDNDPVRFLAYLIAALQSANAIAGSEAQAMLDLPQPAVQAVLASLINEVESAARDVVLVLDDYHMVNAQPVHDALAYLLDHQPPHLRLVIASRADPPLPLALLRGRGQLIELRQSDLRFTPDEAAAFLNQAIGPGLKAGDVAALAARTEGWVAGLQMAAASLRGRDDAPAFVRAFTGSNRYILDYLVDEVLSRQPEAVQSFLLQTSILDRLCAPLCAAVIGPLEKLPFSNLQSLLEHLDRSNLFILPLDDERKWYRYHRLFADLLQKRLGEAHPDLLPALHRRASEWHEQNGLMGEAIDHALAAEEFERAAGLIGRIAEATLMRSETFTFLRWVNALPEAQMRAHPPLCVYQAWALLLGGFSLQAIEAPLKLVQSPTPLTLPLLAVLANYRGETGLALDLSRRALEQLPENEMLLRGLAALYLAVAHHMKGDLASSQRILQEAAQDSRQAGNVMFAVAAMCYRADLCRREGRLREAGLLYQQALDLAADESGRRLPIAGRALMGLGEIAREWNELDTAAQRIAEGMELAGRWAQSDALIAHFSLARIGQARGDWDSVREALQAMRQTAREFKATEADDRLVDMAEAWMQIEQGALEGPRRWAERYGLAGTVDPLALEQDSDPIVRHLHKYEHPVLARLWIAGGRPSEALALLESALPIVEKMNRIGLAIEYEILIALAAQALNQNGKAMQALERALARAELEGYVRIFVDEGKPMARLLHEAASRGIKPEYAGRLLAVFPAAAPPAPGRVEMVEPLSERELEVLRLIAAGLSNDEIAQRLVLSLPTIKWHTGNLYGKLGVKSRTQAVAKARELGMLSAS